MDIFDGRNFRINKASLKFIGQWPFQSVKIRNVCLGTVLMLCGPNFVAKLFAIYDSRNDMEMLLGDLSPINCDLVGFFKLINSAVKIDQMKELLIRVRKHYASITSEKELKIMHGYAEGARKFTVIYIEFFILNMVSYLIPPLIPILTTNGTDRPFIQHVKYFVDPWEYYYPIIIQSYLTIFLFMYIFISMDPIFVMLAQHACGLYRILGHRIRDIANNDGDIVDFYPSKENDESFKNISICIRRHQEAIEFSVLLKSYYSTTFFLQVAVNTIGLSVAGIQVINMTGSRHFFFQQLVVVWTSIAHMFFLCFNGQRLIDHSTRIHEYLIDAKWYLTSIRSTKIMNLMIVRSQYPCTLTAAGMLVMSMETFSAVMRTSMSYFTVLKSTE